MKQARASCLLQLCITAVSELFSQIPQLLQIRLNHGILGGFFLGQCAEVTTGPVLDGFLEAAVKYCLCTLRRRAHHPHHDQLYKIYLDAEFRKLLL
jgi:hypothetical protein